MASDSAAGIYSLAYSISQLMAMFNTALTQTLEPWRYKKLKTGRAEDIAQIAYPSLIFIGVLNLLLMAFAPEIVAIFAPAEYFDTIWVIPTVSMSTYFMFTYGYFAVFEFYYERTSYVMLATMAGAVLNIILNYIFIQIYGYYAAGYTTLVCYVVYSMTHYHFMRKICREELDGKKIYDMKLLIGISLAFMLTGFVMLATYRNIYLRYSLILALAIGLFVKRRVIMQYVKVLINIRKEGKEKA